MGERSRSTLLGGVVVAACPLLCIGLPLLTAAGIGAGLMLAVGGAVVGGVALAGLAVGATLALRRRRREAACCRPHPTEAPAVDGSRAPDGSPLAGGAGR
jgi:uncharacterized membrane protein YdfJ with MMPL/SSD domain